MGRLLSGITAIVQVCPPSVVLPNVAVVVPSMAAPAPPPANPEVGERKCAAYNVHCSVRGRPPIVESTLQRPSGFQVLPPSVLRRCVAWGEFSNSNPFWGLRNHRPLDVPLTVDNSAHVFPSLVPKTLPFSVIAQPFFASRKNTVDRSRSVASGSPPSCTCHVVPPSLVNRMVDLFPTTQQVSGPTHATAFRSR